MSEPINTPKNIENFRGQFVIFFSEDAAPEVIFSSYIAEEAYGKAVEIKNAMGREPIVIRVQENPTNNIAHVLLTRA